MSSMEKDVNKTHQQIWLLLKGRRLPEWFAMHVPFKHHQKNHMIITIIFDPLEGDGYSTGATHPNMALICLNKGVLKPIGFP